MITFATYDHMCSPAVGGEDGRVRDRVGRAPSLSPLPSPPLGRCVATPVGHACRFGAAISCSDATVPRLNGRITGRIVAVAAE